MLAHNLRAAFIVTLGEKPEEDPIDAMMHKTQEMARGRDQ